MDTPWIYTPLTLQFDCGSKFYLTTEPPPRSPRFIRVVHTTGDVICDYRRWQNAPVLQLPFEISVQPCDTVTKCSVPCMFYKSF